jgi:hypothetical protein
MGKGQIHIETCMYVYIEDVSSETVLEVFTESVGGTKGNHVTRTVIDLFGVHYAGSGHYEGEWGPEGR